MPFLRYVCHEAFRERRANVSVLLTSAFASCNPRRSHSSVKKSRQVTLLMSTVVGGVWPGPGVGFTAHQSFAIFWTAGARVPRDAFRSREPRSRFFPRELSAPATADAGCGEFSSRVKRNTPARYPLMASDPRICSRKNIPPLPLRCAAPTKQHGAKVARA